jgi:hypothetical protein
MEPMLLDALGKLWYNNRNGKFQTSIRILELHKGRDTAHHTATVSKHTNSVIVR